MGGIETETIVENDPLFDGTVEIADRFAPEEEQVRTHAVLTGQRLRGCQKLLRRRKSAVQQSLLIGLGRQCSRQEEKLPDLARCSICLPVNHALREFPKFPQFSLQARTCLPRKLSHVLGE